VDYSYLTTEQRAEIIRQRIVQMEQEHYQRELDRKIAERLDNGSGGQMLAEARSAQVIIEAAHAVALEELAALEGR
jgi:hypothetical protein